MDLQLSDKSCLVTGASTGIGRATALRLASEGARVLVTARSLPALQTLAEEIHAAGGPAPVLLEADFARPEGAHALARAALAAAGGRIDVLVNNAGGSRPLARPDDDPAWDEALLLNFLSVRRLTEQVVPGMVERGWGRVLNVSGAVIAKALNAATPAKAALESWSKACAALYAAKGITFNCVAPGRIDSAQIRNKLHPTDASRQDYIDRHIPAGRFGQPEEAAALIAFLVSGPASYVNGTTVPVDGGALRFAF
jgi:3-oxoacyl-[acyl-carrier protein] reductase